MIKASRFALLVAGLLLLRPPGSDAQTALLWDTNPGASGAQGGTGNWLGTNFWNNVFNNVAWTDGANAVFDGTPGTVTVNGAVTASQLAFNVNGYTISGASTLTLAGAARTIFVNNAGQTATISAPIGGSGGFIKAGVGTLTLSGTVASSYTGLVTVTDGTLNLSKSVGVNAITGDLTIGDGTGAAASGIVIQGANNQIPDTATVTINQDGFWNLAIGSRSETIGGLVMGASSVDTGTGTLTLNGDVNIFHPTLAPTTISGGLDLGGGTRSFLTQSNAELIVSGAITNGALVKNGAGQLTLSGVIANTYSGITTVRQGVLVLQKPFAIRAISGDLMIGGGSDIALVMQAADEQIADSATVSVGASGLWSLGSGGPGDHSEHIAALTMSGGSIVTGIGTLTVNGNVTTSANATSASITGRLNLGGVTRTFDIADGTAANDLDISAAISNGAAGLTKTGVGTLRLIGTNNFGGPVTINAGTLIALNGAAIGDSSDVTLANLATLGIESSETINSVTGAGGVALGAGTMLTVAGSNSTVFSGNISGTGGIAKSGTGNLTLSGAPTYTGNTLITAGTLVLNGGIASAAGILTVTVPGTLQARATVNRAIAGDGAITATGTLTIGDGSSTAGFAFDGTLAVGSNFVALSDADAAQLGSTTTLGAGGRLDSLNGAVLGSGESVTVGAAVSASISGSFTNNGTVNGPTSAGQTLTFIGDVNGTGNYTGRVTFADGFSPGLSAAAISLATFELTPTTTLSIELGGVNAGAEFDQLNSFGTGLLDGTLSVSLINGFNPQPGSAFAFIQGGALAGAFDTMNLPPLDPGFSWSYSQTANTAMLAVVPEPSSLASVLAIGIVSVTRRRHRGAKGREAAPWVP